jgi:dihydrofolate reductase
MRKVIVFNHVSIDGYFCDRSGDMSWAHKHDPEWTQFVSGNASSGGELLFGRVTFKMMRGYWTTPEAATAMPTVAAQMNALPKVVFSRTLDEARWSNTRLIASDLPGAVRALKSEPGQDMLIFGSGQIVAQLSEQRLIDEYQMIVCAIALGNGRTLFEGMSRPLQLTRISSRAFSNGHVLNCYEPA